MCKEWKNKKRPRQKKITKTNLKAKSHNLKNTRKELCKINKLK